MQFKPCTKEQFQNAVTTDKEDNFTKYFIGKANHNDQWDSCYGAFDQDILLGGIIVTITKKNPISANIQLLHTFAAHRGKRVGTFLCEESLKMARAKGAKYFRVSARPEAFGFYEKTGFKYWGRQQSGCRLSMFRISDDTIKSGIYDYSDKVIYSAVNKKGQGGCVEIFPELTEQNLKTGWFDEIE